MIIYILLLMNLTLFLYLILKYSDKKNDIENYESYEYDSDDENHSIYIGQDKHSTKVRYIRWLLENKNNIENLSDNDLNNLLRISNNIEVELEEKDKKFENNANDIKAINY